MVAGIEVYMNTVYLVGRESNSVRPHELNTQVDDKLNVQEVASVGDEGCGSATSSVMTIVAKRIDQHPSIPQIITCHMHTVCQGGQPGRCSCGALCVEPVGK
jgi:hypothetical protein